MSKTNEVLMEVYIVFVCSWDTHIDGYIDRIYGVYNSELKAEEVKTSLEKDRKEFYNSLSRFEQEEFKERGYELDKYYIKKYSVV